MLDHSPDRQVSIRQRVQMKSRGVSRETYGSPRERRLDQAHAPGTEQACRIQLPRHLAEPPRSPRSTYNTLKGCLADPKLQDMTFEGIYRRRPDLSSPKSLGT